MLDKRSFFLLKYLNEECGSNFKVLEIADLIKIFPTKLQVDFNSLKHCLTYLEKGGYLTIKYSDKNVYCVCVLPFGMQYVESQNNELKRLKRFESVGTKVAVVMCLFALVGSFLGTLIYHLIFG